MAEPSPHGWTAYVALRRYLVENRDELLDLLKRWDDDGDGKISAKEFRQGWRVLEIDAGLKIPRYVLDELYDEMDVDSTGNIPFDEIALALKHLPLPPETDEGLATVAEDMALGDEEEGASSAPSPRISPMSRRPLKKAKGATPLGPASAGSPTPGGSSSGGLPLLVDAGSSSGASSGGHESWYTPRPPDQPWVGERGSGSSRRSHSVEPPRRTNLPRIDGAPSPRSRSVSSYRSGMTGLSSSTAQGLTQKQLAARRARTERELQASFDKQLKGDLSEAQRYQPLHGGTTLQVSSHPSASFLSETAQHVIDDAMGNPINFNKKTFYGDPARYVSHNHETGRTRTNLSGHTFVSPVPQRPHWKRSQQMVRGWQMWNGHEGHGKRSW